MMWLFVLFGLLVIGVGYFFFNSNYYIIGFGIFSLIFGLFYRNPYFRFMSHEESRSIGENNRKLNLILWGLVVGAIGFAMQYYNLFENQYISYGVMGLGIILILLGLFTKKKY